jgi:hypothetical protein
MRSPFALPYTDPVTIPLIDDRVDRELGRLAGDPNGYEIPQQDVMVV